MFHPLAPTMDSDKASHVNLAKEVSRRLAGQDKGGGSGNGVRRRSRRLSGQLPSVSLREAEAAVASPRGQRSRSRRSSVGSEDGGTSVGPSKKAVNDAANTVVEVIPEEEELEEVPAVAPVAPAAEKESGPPAVPVPTTEAGPSASEKASKSQPSSTYSGRPQSVQASIPRGRCKSGRVWKGDRDRFRSVIKDNKGLKQSYESRKRQKEERLRAKRMEETMR